MADSRQAQEERPFRFFDNREKYLQFVTTTGEKWAVAERVGAEVEELAPRPPALQVFDAGMGDGTVLTGVLRYLHGRFPTVPFLVVGKEISVEDVRMSLEKLPDRFAEHPEMVVAVTNMHYREAPHLQPETPDKQAALQWSEVVLEGATAHEFDEQIVALQPLLEERWQVRGSTRTGNPLYVEPAVLVIYRADRRFVLDRAIPRERDFLGAYDLVIAAQPYRSRTPAEAKVDTVLAPLARALAPGGRMVVVQSTGQDPGMEIIRGVWAEEAPFQTPAPLIMKVLRERLNGAASAGAAYRVDLERHALFRFSLQAQPGELVEPVSASTLLAAWNAATYVAQIDDNQVAEAMSHSDYLAATRDVLARHGGLWFIDESFVVERLGIAD